jgi:predicted O-methyltransferase YrrM
MADASRQITELADLRSHVEEAYAAGQTIDLEDVVYGPMTGGSGYRDETMPYYRLLAGHAAITDASTVVEIGTHYGGSTLALLAGLRAGASSNPLLVTMDVTELNVERLAREPEIVRLTGDSTEVGFVQSLATLLPTSTPDLLYIDALKDAGYVLRTLHNVHRAGLEPTWLILDDIQATPSMQALWDVLEEIEPHQAFLLSREFPEIRDPRYGYAIIHVAGTNQLMSRCVELMERLGLDTTGMLDSADRFADVRSAAVASGFATRFPSAPTAGSSDTELSLLDDLARTHVRGDGDVVDFGCTIGTTTRALAEGLSANEHARSGARVHAYDSFVHDHPSLDRVLGDDVAEGASLVPLFTEALAEHDANLYAIEPHLARWYGAPIELFVGGAIRTARTNAHLISEFSPYFLAGKTVLVYREALLPYRPWIALTMAYLHEHLELLRLSDSAAVLGFVSPLRAEQITRLIEDRFTAVERLELIRGYAEGLAVPEFRWSLLAQAGAIAVGLQMLSEASDIAAALDDLGNVGGVRNRKGRLVALRKRIDEASERIPEVSR